MEKLNLPTALKIITRLRFIYDGVILTDIDHTIINPNFSTYVEFSEDDLAVKEYTGCSYDDSAFAWTYIHFHEPISRLSCDQSGYHIPGSYVPIKK